MTDGRGVVREVAWRELFPWLLLFRTFRLAIHPTLLTIALLAAIVTPLGWSLGRAIFRVYPPNPENPLAVPEGERPESWLQLMADADERERLPGVNRPPTIDLVTRLQPQNWSRTSPVLYVYERFSTPILRMYRTATSLQGFAFYSFGTLWTLAVWSLAGGMITRMTAIELGREEQASLKNAFRLSLRRWFDYFTAPLYPVLGTLLLAICCVPVGWLLYSSDVGVIIAGLLWIFVILAGAVMAMLLLWLFIGWPLMWPAISAEETGDSFEAMSRSFAYAFQRPLHYLFYVVLAAAFGLVGWAVVDFACYLTLEAAHWAVSWGAWHERMLEIETTQKPAEGVTALWVGVMMLRGLETIPLAISEAFAYSYFWVAATVIYLLLRQQLDRAEFDDVWLEEDAPRFPVPSAANEPAPQEIKAAVPASPSTPPINSLAENDSGE